MDTRQRIEDRARELFMRFGIRSVSMDDIAGSVGMSKKTIYASYADKDALVEAVIGRHIAESEQKISELIRESVNAVDEILMTIRLFESQFRNLNPIVLHDLQKFHPSAYRLIEQHKQQFVLQTMRVNMQRGIREGLFRADMDVEVMSRFQLESMMLVFDPQLFPPEQFNLADVSREIHRHYLFGMCTPYGQTLVLNHIMTKDAQ
jgi:TetR/AcrR family transcriptional regulator, cholesterol catabolism regulator